MNSFSLASLVFPAILGLITGVGHGILSHHADLPISLSEQLELPMQINQGIEK